MQIIYITFCLHEKILLDIIKNLEQTGRKMAGKNVIKEKMSHRINVEIKQALAKFSKVDKSIL